MWLAGLAVAAISAVLRCLDVARLHGVAPFAVFPSLLHNIVLLVTRRQSAALTAAALCAGSVFLAPTALPLESLARVLAETAAWAFVVVEAAVVVLATQRWAVWVGAKCQDERATTWRAAVLSLSVVELLVAAYVLLWHVEGRALAAAAAVASVAVVGHNILHEDGVIVSATTAVLWASCWIAVGSSSSWVAGVVAGQLLTPLALALLGACQSRFAVLMVLLSIYARTDLRWMQGLLTLVLAPTVLIWQGSSS